MEVLRTQRVPTGQANEGHLAWPAWHLTLQPCPYFPPSLPILYDPGLRGRQARPMGGMLWLGMRMPPWQGGRMLWQQGRQSSVRIGALLAWGDARPLVVLHVPHSGEEGNGNTASGRWRRCNGVGCAGYVGKKNIHWLAGVSVKSWCVCKNHSTTPGLPDAMSHIVLRDAGPTTSVCWCWSRI